MAQNQNALVSIIMGSLSDHKVMKECYNTLMALDIPYETQIVSAHRTPEFMMEFAQAARSRGLKVIIAAAGGAAHLPGMVASLTTLPVIGVPIKSRNSIEGIDSLYSIVQMPAGVPVATMAIDGACNAALLAAQILSTSDEKIAKRLEDQKKELKAKVDLMNKELKKQ